MKNQKETIRKAVRYLHLIPPGPQLRELDQFAAVIEARKRLIAEKFAWLLQGVGTVRFSISYRY